MTRRRGEQGKYRQPVNVDLLFRDSTMNADPPVQGPTDLGIIGGDRVRLADSSFSKTTATRSLMFFPSNLFEQPTRSHRVTSRSGKLQNVIFEGENSSLKQGTPKDDGFLSDLCMFRKNRGKITNSLSDLLEFPVGWSRVWKMEKAAWQRWWWSGNSRPVPGWGRKLPVLSEGFSRYRENRRQCLRHTGCTGRVFLQHIAGTPYA